ncbi:MAG: peptide chain release factor N(5)-glutamine methyltransferase, partial [Anaerolineae bacterium]|nr:peptide chain release factor N(5)-glutamine methyltransferase [Anaerolineae bacterium]
MNQTKINVGDWLAAARKRLAANHPSAAIETQAILAWVTGKPRSTLLAHPESILTLDQKQVADNALDRLIQGIPLPYITGTQEFYGLSFRVSPAVLIPRPETELLVETALQAMKSHPSPVQALDVGTGSGAIAVSLAVCNSAIHVTALDISPAALEIARCNALQHNVEQRILYLHENLTNNVQGRFDLVCANLPYIPTETTLQLDV